MNVTIYTTQICPYCQRAKALLRKKGVEFDEIDVSYDSEMRLAMTRRAKGRTSVPQIFVGETHVGGCDDLYALDARGGFDPLLAGSCPARSA
jgi:glutaredoxin 3